MTGSFADFTFGSPTASLTINLGAGDDRITIETFDRVLRRARRAGGRGRDRIDFAGTVATRGHDLIAAAEKIVVAPGSDAQDRRRRRRYRGDIVLAAAATSTDALAAADSSVTMVDATLIGRNITISASATFISAADFIDGGSAASVDIFGSEVIAARTITIDVHSFVLAQRTDRRGGRRDGEEHGRGADRRRGNARGRGRSRGRRRERRRRDGRGRPGGGREPSLSRPSRWWTAVRRSPRRT